jgi:hypothetical protein
MKMTLESGADGEMGGDAFSRNPSDYRPDPNGHFRRRLDERDIPPCVVKMAIEGGEATLQENGNVRLETSYLGYDFAVVVEPRKQYAVTAFPLGDW